MTTGPRRRVIGSAASIFVGFNIGGSSTGIASGPSAGAGIVEKTTAAGLMTMFAFLGGWTVGRHFYPALVRRFGLSSSEGSLLELGSPGRACYSAPNTSVTWSQPTVRRNVVFRP